MSLFHPIRRAGRAVHALIWAAPIVLIPPLSSSAHAQVIVYPARGQTADQTQRDKGECMSWATQQSGFDPTAPQYSGAPPPSSAPTGAPMVQGAARGAALGAVGGAIGGNAGKGAAIGAGTGALIGGIRRRDQQQQQEQWQQQQSAQSNQQQGNFNRAYSACLEGRGYTVR